MTPCMVSHFVAVLYDFRGTVGMLMHEFSGDKERAGGMRIREGRNQIIKALRFGSCVECQSNFLLATWASIYLAETPDLFDAGGATAGGGPRFHMRSMQKGRRG